MSTSSGGKSENPPSPGHDWSSRPPARRVSNASTTSPSSIGGSLDSTSHRRRSTVAELGQNAISTLLQLPILRTELLPHTVIHSTSQKPPTSRDIPPVALTDIPHVDSSAFKDYLSQVGSLFDAFQCAKLESEDGGVYVFRQNISAAKDDELALCGRRKTSVSRRRQFAPTPLSGKGVNGNPQPAGKALTTNTISQEKLSWYMDTVEIHLISSISQASASFFAALGSLRELQAEAADSVAKIQKLREDLAHLDKEMAVRGFEIISMKRRRDNLRKLGEATKQLQYVLSGASHCEELVDYGQLEKAIHHISPEDAEAFFVKVYCGIGEALRRLGVQVKVLLDITSGMKKTPSTVLAPVQSPGSMGNPAVRSLSLSMGCNLQEEMTRALDMSSLLGQAVNKAQSETTKVLQVRIEQTVRLGLTDFLSYFTLNRLFVNECEAISGHSGAALKGVVNNQIHDFVPLLHKVEKQKLAQRMESEKWERIDFMPGDAVILAHLTNGTPTESTSAAKQDKKYPTLAVIEEEKFVPVDSVAFALRGIEQYTILLASVSSMANEISTVLLDYLKLYNSHTQQLVLGAGAKLTAGLTNINTGHLALASQSLSFFIALIPYLRECVRRRLSITSSGIGEYDRLKRLFQDHQSSIHDKLIDIMSFRATVCIGAMEKIKWDNKDEVQVNVSPHMETLTKEALTLQRVPSKYLPALSVRMIVRRVFVSYKEQWSKAFEGAVIRTEAGHARLLRDAELLEAKLGKIDGAEGLGAHMISIVNAKLIAS